MAVACLHRLTAAGPRGGRGSASASYANDPRFSRVAHVRGSASRWLLFREKQRLDVSRNELQCHVVESISLAPPRPQQPLRETHVLAAASSSKQATRCAEERRSVGGEKKKKRERRRPKGSRVADQPPPRSWA
ncbi:hypothetical protein MTO96_002656 [Rhipicephalus appendiculatus]